MGRDVHEVGAHQGIREDGGDPVLSRHRDGLRARTRPQAGHVEHLARGERQTRSGHGADAQRRVRQRPASGGGTGGPRAPHPRRGRERDRRRPPPPSGQQRPGHRGEGARRHDDQTRRVGQATRQHEGIEPREVPPQRGCHGCAQRCRKVRPRERVEVGQHPGEQDLDLGPGAAHLDGAARSPHRDREQLLVEHDVGHEVAPGRGEDRSHLAQSRLGAGAAVTTQLPLALAHGLLQPPLSSSQPVDPSLRWRAA